MQLYNWFVVPATGWIKIGYWLAFGISLLLDAVKTGCSYFTFNIPNTICNNCGHISKHMMDKCEVCGSTDVDYITRIIGYLKKVSKFSEARQKEAEKRYYEKI